MIFRLKTAIRPKVLYFPALYLRVITIITCTFLYIGIFDKKEVGESKVCFEERETTNFIRVFLTLLNGCPNFPNFFTTQ